MGYLPATSEDAVFDSTDHDPNAFSNLPFLSKVEWAKMFAATLQDPPKTADAQRSAQALLPDPPRFKIGQEVFILSTNQSDPTGLATYMVITDNEFDETGKRQYRLVPLASATYRAAENRLLEAGYALGAEVQRIGDFVPAIVVRRYVVNGERMYGLKDKFEVMAEGVREMELQPHVGGVLTFVTPAAPFC